MTYFVRSDDGFLDDMDGLEIDAVHEILVTAANHGQEIGCLLPDEHDPRHPKDFKFHVHVFGEDEWRDITEQEMLEIVKAGGYLIRSSQFDWWWDQ